MNISKHYEAIILSLITLYYSKLIDFKVKHNTHLTGQYTAAATRFSIQNKFLMMLDSSIE
jgi:hypothetical protein